MLYISKGQITERNGSRIVVNLRGRTVALAGEQAHDWLLGHYAPGYLGRSRLYVLEAEGLVETQPGKQFLPEVYRMLLNSVVAPRERKLPYAGLKEDEKTLLRWIREAGLRLTTPELVRIMELELVPEPEYLGTENRQRLVEAIYTTENIADGQMEAGMERSPAMPETVAILLRLLKKRRVILI